MQGSNWPGWLCSASVVETATLLKTSAANHRRGTTALVLGSCIRVLHSKIQATPGTGSLQSSHRLCLATANTDGQCTILWRAQAAFGFSPIVIFGHRRLCRFLKHYRNLQKFFPLDIVVGVTMCPANNHQAGSESPSQTGLELIFR